MGQQCLLHREGFRVISRSVSVKSFHFASLTPTYPFVRDPQWYSPTTFLSIPMDKNNYNFLRPYHPAKNFNAPHISGYEDLNVPFGQFATYWVLVLTILGRQNWYNSAPSPFIPMEKKVSYNFLHPYHPAENFIVPHISGYVPHISGCEDLIVLFGQFARYRVLVLVIMGQQKWYRIGLE